MTELSFLVDLLVNHKLSAPIKKLVADRIKDVESNQVLNTAHIPNHKSQIAMPQVIHGAVQAPSMAAKIAEMEQVPQSAIVVSPIAAQAIAQRAELMRKATSGKPDKGAEAPNKFRAPLK